MVYAATVPGETQLGPFTIERELGRGGMGVVYAARHEGRAVALKVSIDDQPERDRKHFLEEAALLSKISHPGVVQILDSGAFEDGRPYLVMPLLVGRTLAEQLQRGRLPADLAIRLFVQLAGAVAALHEAGVVHRDIKVENVMYLPDEERLVLLDFGIAREIERPQSTTTRMNLVRGTPGCMAPERFFGTRASEASDVYELAVVLYAMVAGQLPWDEPTDPEARLRPRHPSELGVELPVGLGHILLEALSTRPDRRPSARELLVRVRAVEGAPLSPGSGPHAHTTVALPQQESPPPRARTIEPPSDARPRREIPALAWFAGALVLTASALGGSLWVRTTRARSRLALPAAQPEASALAGAAGDPTTEKAAEPLPPPAPPSASAAATTEPVAGGTSGPTPAAPPHAATPAPPRQAAPAAVPPSCVRLAELYCSPAALARPGGEAICKARREDIARIAKLDEDIRNRNEAACKASIPQVEALIKAPQGSESPEDMPYCKRVAASYCSPEVRAVMNGEAHCAGGRDGFYTRYLGMPPEVRIAQNQKCAQILPAIIITNKDFVRDWSPGGVGYKNAMARSQGAPPPGVAPPGPGPVPPPPSPPLTASAPPRLAPSPRPGGPGP
jgi:serine/threonine protein kinase